MNVFFRRDAAIRSAPGTIIAEFSSGSDAVKFCELKGSGHTVTPGINHVFAVRIAAAIESSASPVGCADSPPGGKPHAQLAAGGDFSSPMSEALATVLGRPMRLIAHTERGKQALPELMRRLPHGDTL